MSLLTLLITILAVIYILTILIAFLYICLILFNWHFHNTNNIFIANICLSVILTCVYFLIYFQKLSLHNSPSLCVLYHFSFHLASIDIPFAFLAFTVHRFCSVIYHIKGLFKKKRWVTLCILSHWLVQCILSLPFISQYDPLCRMKPWIAFYVFTTAVIIPLFINTVLNVRIFLHVQRSSRRIQPEILSLSTTGTNNQQLKMSRRDLSLLKHMIFTFLIFVIGWIPILITNIIDLVIADQYLSILACMFLSVFCTLAMVIYLFLCNHDIRQYLFQIIRRCFRL